MRRVPLAPISMRQSLPVVLLVSSGADLANPERRVLFAVRGKAKRVVSMVEFEKAKDKIMMGGTSPMVMTGAKESMAYQAGRAIIGSPAPEHDPVQRRLSHAVVRWV